MITSRTPRVLGVLLLALAMTPLSASAETDDATAPVALAVRGSPALRGQSGKAGSAEIRVHLAEPSDLRVRIADFEGRSVRTLMRGSREAGTYRRRWDGRDDGGRLVPAGPYRAIATADLGDRVARAQEWITLADQKVYPRRPGLITVVLDPGHGGSRTGAKGRDGTREADLNLDIAKRAAAMLEGAGVDVVLTRETEAAVNEPAIDRTGDGLADDTDELAARTDIANEARADLFISVHNNTAVNTGVGGPSTYYSDERTFRDRSERLARIIQDEMVAALRRYADASWEPFDHGALTYPYYVLRDYDPPRLLRPSQMPAVLSEGMFLSHPRELRLLKRPLVRGAMAVAYYDAIARYLADRSSHIGYRLIAGPAELSPGETGVFEVEVRNTGSAPMRGWTLPAGALPAPFMYEGQGRRGAAVGKSRIPPLPPGKKATVRIRVAAPERSGDWLVLFDARDGEGTRMSRLGAPALQVPLAVAPPPATPASPGPEG